MNNNYVVIMAGGSGTRLWPYSREKYPKQFLDLTGVGKSLLQQTVERFEGICPQENIVIVAGEHYKSIIQAQLPNLNADFLLLEPMRKNTAPCIAYACQKIYKQNPEANIVITPADHLIIQTEKFKEKINIALEEAKKKEALITLGISPTRPDTSYGYIQFENTEEAKSFTVKAFTEKPPLELAEKFLATGEFLWNAGIFVWKAQVILDTYQKLLPDVAEAFQEINEDYFTEKEKNSLEKAYSLCKNVSVDYGIMEGAENVFVVKSDFDWSDLGSWNTLYDSLNKDEEQNGVIGHSNIILQQSKDNLVKIPKEKLAVLVGLEDYAVIDHENVLFICPRSELVNIKDFLRQAKNYNENSKNKKKNKDKYI